jgi:hypothetical protein
LPSLSFGYFAFRTMDRCRNEPASMKSAKTFTLIFINLSADPDYPPPSLRASGYLTEADNPRRASCWVLSKPQYIGLKVGAIFYPGYLPDSVLGSARYRMHSGQNGELQGCPIVTSSRGPLTVRSLRPWRTAFRRDATLDLYLNLTTPVFDGSGILSQSDRQTEVTRPRLV